MKKRLKLAIRGIFGAGGRDFEDWVGRKWRIFWMDGRGVKKEDFRMIRDLVLEVGFELDVCDWNFLRCRARNEDMAYYDAGWSVGRCFELKSWDFFCDLKNFRWEWLEMGVKSNSFIINRRIVP